MAHPTFPIRPGLYERLSFAAYQAIPAINPSTAIHGLTSMKSLRHALDHGGQAPTAAMAFGTACHVAFWEPDEFPLRYALWSGARRAGHEWQAFCAANQGKQVLTERDYRDCLGIRDSARSHPAVRKYLQSTLQRELSLIWQDPSTGVLCKGRLDCLAPPYIPDLKTTSSIDERSIQRRILELHYAMKMAAYVDGYHTLTGQTLDPVFIFVCVDAPHEVKVRTLAPRAVDHGRQRWQTVLQQLKSSRQTGRWPGIDDCEGEIDLPDWCYSDDQPLQLTFGGEAISA